MSVTLDLTVTRDLWLIKFANTANKNRPRCQSNQPQIVTILQILLKFQHDRTCFQGEVSANFGEKVEYD